MKDALLYIQLSGFATNYFQRLLVQPLFVYYVGNLLEQIDLENSQQDSVQYF
jgi:hypothetical protein